MPSSSLAITSARLPRVDLYRLLADSGRLQILALCAEGELSVGELGSLLNERQPQVSRRVAPLGQGGLLEARRDGTRTWVGATSGIGPVDPGGGGAVVAGRGVSLRSAFSLATATARLWWSGWTRPVAQIWSSLRGRCTTPPGRHRRSNLLPAC